jgi:ATP adenylyltransferase
MTTDPRSDHHHHALPAPWRLKYLESLGSSERATGKISTGSFLRDNWLTPELDIPNHIIVRAQHGMILLNKYPYANGHLLVALAEARPALLEYSEAQRAHLWRLVDCATDLVLATLDPQGVNIGINQGRAAGAGVPSHLHVHLVPRWGGDSNFIDVVGRVRVIPAALEDMADRYRAAWSRIKDRWPL